MRLDQLIRKATGRSGRALREVLRTSDVRVNGALATSPGQPVGRFDHVELDGLIVQANTARYLALHKPAGVVSATTDPEHRTVIDLIGEPWREELHLAGRLDRFTTGLVILTNDSDFSEALTLPGRKVPKGYRVETNRAITPDAAAAIRTGMRFDKENVTTHPAQLELAGERSCNLTIFEGKHHQVKRMFARFDIKVEALHRFRIGEIWLEEEQLPPGSYRDLHPEELRLG